LKQAETKFKEKVSRWLKNHPNIWFVKIQMVSTRGIPDYLICVSGQFLGIELKSSKTATRAPLQEWTLNAIAAAGGIGLVVFPENWESTKVFIEEMAKGENADDVDFDVVMDRGSN